MRTRVKVKKRLGDSLAESFIYASGGILLVIILAIFYYLVHESKYAFKQNFPYSFRVALQPQTGEYEKDLSLDPNASIIAASAEGAEGVDEKEETLPLGTLADLSGIAKLATGTGLTSQLEKVDPSQLYRDDWRPSRPAERGDKYLIFGFATPEYTDEKMYLAWGLEEGFNPSWAPYQFRLTLLKAPDGITVEPFSIDLRKQSSGRIEIPSYIAKSDEDRLKGYVFQLEAIPTTSTTLATISNFFKTDWGPTLANPRFGFVPLLLSTLLITLLAIMIAIPLSVGAAVYVSELAPKRIREWLKPIIELLASIPTVVLAYFGLMLVAPQVQKYVSSALGLDSGRTLLTTSIIMGFLLIPTIMTVAEDALRAIPQGIREGGEALGLTQRESLKRVVLPSAKSGLIAAIMLGVARAVGETMIIWILSGGTPNMPSFASVQDGISNLAKPTRGIPDTIGIEMGNVAFEDTHYGHLFLLGLTLFLLTLAINIVAHRYSRKVAWRH